MIKLGSTIGDVNAGRWSINKLKKERGLQSGVAIFYIVGARSNSWCCFLVIIIIHFRVAFFFWGVYPDSFRLFTLFAMLTHSYLQVVNRKRK